jgi:hypothetical protein
VQRGTATTTRDDARRFTMYVLGFRVPLAETGLERGVGLRL